MTSFVKAPEKVRRLMTGGSFARKQLLERNFAMNFSHGARYRMARRLSAPYAGKRLLDYGCGDGTFLLMVNDLFASAAGADIDPKQVAECTRRLGESTGFRFLHTAQLDGKEYRRAFDIVTCMEVLEHCTSENVAKLLVNLERLLAPDGAVVISVPIETGPSLLVKEVFRSIAGWRRIGDYQFKERYDLSDLMSMLFADENTVIRRDVFMAHFPNGEKSPYHGHKGFNWRFMRRLISEKFEIVSEEFSPLPLFKGLINSQAWFVCGLKDGRRRK